MLPSMLICIGVVAASPPPTGIASTNASSSCRIVAPASTVNRRTVEGCIVTPVKCASNDAAGVKGRSMPRRTAPATIQGE